MTLGLTLFSLKRFAPKNPSHYRVDVSFSQETDQYCVEFLVVKDAEQSWVLNKNYGFDPRANWGLWENDVVECFLQARGHSSDTSAPYLELQLSPLGQPFALWVIKPRVNFFTPLEDHLKLEFSSQVEGNHWKSKIYIKKDLFGPNSLLYGSFNACLGSEKREFWGINFKENDALDFHRPERFIELK